MSEFSCRVHGLNYVRFNTTFLEFRLLVVVRLTEVLLQFISKLMAIFGIKRFIVCFFEYRKGVLMYFCVSLLL
jgi:hypothetical protein